MKYTQAQLDAFKTRLFQKGGDVKGDEEKTRKEKRQERKEDRKSEQNYRKGTKAGTRAEKARTKGQIQEILMIGEGDDRKVYLVSKTADGEIEDLAAFKRQNGDSIDGLIDSGAKITTAASLAEYIGKPELKQMKSNPAEAIASSVAPNETVVNDGLLTNIDDTEYNPVEPEDDYASEEMPAASPKEEEEEEPFYSIDNAPSSEANNAEDAEKEIQYALSNMGGTPTLKDVFGIIKDMIKSPDSIYSNMGLSQYLNFWGQNVAREPNSTDYGWLISSFKEAVSQSGSEF